MTQCLPDDVLWLLSEGEGASAERTHLEGCATCTDRYQQLAHDLQVIRQVLQEPPPLSLPVRTRRRAVVRWAPVAVALAAAVAVFWSGVLKQQPPPTEPLTSAKVRDEEVKQFLTQEVSSALFATNELEVMPLPTRVSSLAYLQAALDGGWPCERPRLSRQRTCADRPLFVLAEEQ
jgi:hypothetical protein